MAGKTGGRRVNVLVVSIISCHRMEENEHLRLDWATEQLEVAVELFLAKRSFVCALTLAGAAEELLGKALNHNGRDNWRQEQFKLVNSIECAFGIKYEWKTFCAETNRVRNAAKHFQNPQENIIASDIEDDSLQMIVRAIVNYRYLGLPDKEFIQNFSAWFNQEVVGCEYEY